MATVTGADARTDLHTLTALVRAMFPHASFPAGPYERTAAAILDAAGEDVRLRAQIMQGLRDLDAASAGGSFAGLDAAAAASVLDSMCTTVFFEAVRAKTILTLYNDPEVWSLLGWEGASFDQGGYLHRGFDDLDWLPAPRIEEAS